MIVANQTLFAQNWLGLLGAIQSLPTYNQYLKGERRFPPAIDPPTHATAKSQQQLSANYSLQVPEVTGQRVVSSTQCS